MDVLSGFRRGDPYHVREAETKQERYEQFRLVHDCYVESGFILPQFSGVRIREWDSEDVSRMFGAYNGVELCGVMSIIRDSEIGLPIYKTYPSYKSLRWLGPIVEVSNMAVLAAHRRSRAIYDLIVAVVEQSIKWDCFGGVAEVTPAQAKFWIKVFGFEKIGDPRVIDGETKDVVQGLFVRRESVVKILLDADPCLSTIFSAADMQVDLTDYT